MAGTSAVENMAYVKARTPTLEGTMFNWKTRERAQEIFALTLAIGVLLTLASAIPAWSALLTLATSGLPALKRAGLPAGKCSACCRTAWMRVKPKQHERENRWDGQNKHQHFDWPVATIRRKTKVFLHKIQHGLTPPKFNEGPPSEGKKKTDDDPWRPALSGLFGDTLSAECMQVGTHARSVLWSLTHFRQEREIVRGFFGTPTITVRFWPKADIG
jgi:hypothetical protein